MNRNVVATLTVGGLVVTVFKLWTLNTADAKSTIITVVSLALYWILLLLFVAIRASINLWKKYSKRHWQSKANS